MSGSLKEMKKLRLVVISDDEMIPEFAMRGLSQLEEPVEVYLLSCTNNGGSRRPLHHALYYLLNILSIRNSLNRPVAAKAAGKQIVAVRSFEALNESGWQRLPLDVIAWLNEVGPDAVLKFGMNLLRVPAELRVPILSYHHGDPGLYRGRPAGFYELLHGRNTLGQMVQIIGNRLDAGVVVAYGETKVHLHSYRSTLQEAFHHSPLLLPIAIANAIAGRKIPRPATGRNYRLPSNGTVMRFAGRLLLGKLKRAAYGAFFEKVWRVSLAPATVKKPALPAGAQDRWTTLPTPRGCRFLADPFFSKAQGGILVEALNRSSGVGEIRLWDGRSYRQVFDAPGHASYPATAMVDGRELITPEIAAWSSVRAYEASQGGFNEVAKLRVSGGEPVLDPTLVEHEGRLYLFGNVRRYPNALMLWSAPSIHHEFVTHPRAPILISPRGARMGGAIWNAEGQLYRLGQNWLNRYGDGLVSFRIEKLSATEYGETPIDELRFIDRRGPHTLNTDGQHIIFDWYDERFSLMAGPRRAIAKLRR
jgi:hypothetical protein